MNVAILGAGHGGTAMAAHLMLNGHSVRLYDKYPDVLRPIREAGFIRVTGVIGEGEYRPDLVSDSLEDAVTGAEAVMVVTPAFAHGEIAENVAPHLEDDQVIVLHPGRTGGALEFRRIIREMGCARRVYVAEAGTLLYACRKMGPTEVRVMGVKQKVRLAALPSTDTAHVLGVIGRLFPQFAGARNVLETSLMNIGAVFHPAPTLLNMGRIEETLGDFLYYHQGITRGVARIVERVDGERVDVARALGVEVVPAREWLAEAYGVGGDTLYERIQNNAAYSGVKAPGNMNVRYITEDVPTGLVPLSSLGRVAGVKTPVMDALIDLASALHDRDYRATGRNETTLGIRGLTPAGLQRFVDETAVWI
ncbi:MAG: NAD(P)-binding domain-containing protein [Firmicutes bacterium]|nr:NAD(P)-binding domain-containing protein [Bacillota bacterium]